MACPGIRKGGGGGGGGENLKGFVLALFYFSENGKENDISD